MLDEDGEPIIMDIGSEHPNVFLVELAYAVNFQLVLQHPVLHSRRAPGGGYLWESTRYFDRSDGLGQRALFRISSPGIAVVLDTYSLLQPKVHSLGNHTWLSRTS